MKILKKMRKGISKNNKIKSYTEYKVNENFRKKQIHTIVTFFKNILYLSYSKNLFCLTTLRLRISPCIAQEVCYPKAHALVVKSTF